MISFPSRRKSDSGGSVKLPVGSLTAEQRRICTMRFVDRKTDEQVAQALNLSVVVVRAAVNKARNLILRHEIGVLHGNEAYPPAA